MVHGPGGPERLTTLTIRDATSTDAPFVVALWRDVEDVLASVTDDEDAVRELLERDPTALLVAEDDGQVVATLIVGWDGWRGNLYRLAVQPDHRRRGVAAALVGEAERRLLLVGCRRIAAVVALGEEHAVGFWAAAGYARSAGIGRFVKTLEEPP